MPSLSGCFSVRAGKLDRRISILRYGAPVDDGYTLIEGELGVLVQRSASWRPATRKEQFENAGTEAKAGGIFWIRSDTDTRHIAETDKLVFEGRMFDILGFSEIGRREGIELLVAADDDGTEIDISGLSPIPIASDIEIRVEAIEALIENTDLEQGDGIDIVGNDIRLDIDHLPLAPGN
jgi:head-tail adaptor